MAALIASRKRTRPPGLVGQRARLLVLGTVGLCSVFGCGESTIVPPTLTPGQLYWALELNQHAVMLALQPQYDTVQLTATPISAAGTMITTTGTVRYESLDTTIVTVSTTGLVTTRGTTPASQPVAVVATLQDPQQGITHVDTAYIAVTDVVPPAITAFSMQPATADSAKRALGTYRFFSQDVFDWPVRAVDANQDTVCGGSQGCTVLVHYQSARPLIATIDPLTGHVTPHDTGHVVFTAQTLAYHQVLRDSVQFQLGYPVFLTINISLTPRNGGLVAGFKGMPQKFILGVGAVVMFWNNGFGNSPATFHPVDVVFDHPEAVDSASCVAQGFVLGGSTGSGNIAPFGDATSPFGTPFGANFACRRFPTPGVYKYHSMVGPSDTYEFDIQQDPQ